MQLKTTYRGRNLPFEGDRTLMLKSLPVHAYVHRAIATLHPTVPQRASLEQTYTFGWSDAEPDRYDAAQWGITRTPESNAITVDFHGRRTLAAVQGTGSGELQVDLGGTLVNVAQDGTIATNGDLFSVTFSPEPLPLPGLTVNKLRLNNAGGAVVEAITLRSIPTNVSLRLGDQPPFWSHRGEMATAQTSRDFADQLNAFLSEAPPLAAGEAFYAIPLVLHSDAIAELDIEVTVDYIIDRSLLPAEIPEMVIPYGLSTLPGLEPITLPLPRQAIPIRGRTQASLRGQFASTRIAAGPVGAAARSPIPARVTPECSLAQPFTFDRAMTLTGIDVPLGNLTPGQGQFHIAIQQDFDGKPSGNILTSAAVKVEKPLPGQSSWGTAQLPTPWQAERGTRYWLILQSLQGQGEWATQSLEPRETGLFQRDSGESWHAVEVQGGSPWVAAQFRLNPPAPVPSQPPNGTAEPWIGSTLAIALSPGFSLAQPFLADQDVTLTTLAVNLTSEDPQDVHLTLTLQADAGGQPTGETLTVCAIHRTAADLASTPWVTVPLAAPLALALGQRYWLVLTGEGGAIAWNAQPVPVLHCSRNDGLSWQPLRQRESPTDSVMAQFRLRQTPDRFTMPLQLQLGQGETARRFSLRQFDPLGKVEFDFPFDSFVTEYLADPSIPPRCTPQDGLPHGDPDTTTDATRRLFGFDAGEATFVEGSDQMEKIIAGKIRLTDELDLSVERSIRLAVAINVTTHNGGSAPNTGAMSPPKILTIHCHGKTPERTPKSTIVEKINTQLKAFITRVMGLDISPLSVNVADISTGSLTLTSQQLTLTDADGQGTEITITPERLLPVVEQLTAEYWEIADRNRDKIWRQKLPQHYLLDDRVWPLHWCPPAYPIEERDKGDRFATFMIADGDQSSSLSQIISVTAGCPYQFRFHYFQISQRLLEELFPGYLSDSSSLTDIIAPFSWKVQWLDKNANVLGTHQQEKYGPAYQFWSEGTEVPDQIPQILAATNRGIFAVLEERLTAPAGAVKAVIQFTQMAPGILILHRVSFQPPATLFGNATFLIAPLQAENRTNLLPDPWQLLEEGGTLSPIHVVPGNAYELAIAAYPFLTSLNTTPPGLSPTNQAEIKSIDQRAHLTLTWQGRSDISPINIPLDGSEFNGHLWMGIAPPRATHAEITLHTGPEQLLLESLSFTPTREQPVSLLSPWTLEQGVVDTVPNLPEVPAQIRLRGNFQGREIPTVEYDLLLLSLDRVDDLPAQGKKQFIVAKIQDFYHLRIFNRTGYQVLDQGKDEFQPDTALTQRLETAFRHQTLDSSTRQGIVQQLATTSGYIPEKNPATIVSQTVEVVAGDTYELSLSAQLEFTTLDRLQTNSAAPSPQAWLELQWFAGDIPIADTPENKGLITLPVQPEDLSLHCWRGEAPETATHAQIRLIQMGRETHLRVESIAFFNVNLLSVPMTFLAEAPGELKVTNLHLAYDVPQFK